VATGLEREVESVATGLEREVVAVAEDIGIGGAKVLITGVSGWVGSWCMQKCLEAGYFVIGTVRDPNSPKCAFLKEAIEGNSPKISAKAKTHLKLVKADLLSGEAFWEKIFAENPGIEYVLHTASPFFTTEPKDPNDMLKPAIEGTTCVLKAAVKSGVKRAVVTSSIFAIWEPIVNGKAYSPSDWSNPEVQGTYGKSKTLAEKAAWETVKGSKTELCTANPTWIIGPTLYTDPALLDGFESGSMIKKIATGNMGMVPGLMFALTDVRDVAKAHVLALTNTNAKDKRFILSNKTQWFQEIQTKFARHLGAKPAGKVPSCCFPCLALVLPEAKEFKKSLDKAFEVDAKKTSEILEFRGMDEEATIKDMVSDFIALGAVKKV